MASKYLEKLMPMVDAIAATFGRNCEVVLHDFSKPHKSIIKIANGHVTGRDVGAPATDLILSLIEKNTVTRDALVGYRTKTSRGGELKSTTVFIRNSKDKIVGALCINIDITPYTSAKNALEELCLISSTADEKEEKESPEKFESSVDNLIDDLLEQALKKNGKPVVHMRKEDKLNIIRDLKERGLFLIKGAARKLSRELHVSLATIYKYLEEINRV